VACRFFESFAARAGFSRSKENDMKKNVGLVDRAMRCFGALAMIAVAFIVPAQAVIRFGLGASGLYVLFTAVAGTCLGYRLMGLSTCPLERR